MGKDPLNILEAQRAFDTRGGVRKWLGRVERSVQMGLSAYVWPFVPGLNRIYGRQLANSLERVQIDVPMPGLDQTFDGTRILFLSDLHAGPFLGKQDTVALFEKMEKWKPDAVCWVGDMMTSRVAELIPIREALESWNPPLGQFAVLGNHEHYTEDVELLVDMLEASNVRVLQNRAIAFERHGCRLWLAGVDDWRTGEPNLNAALAPWRERGSKEPMILLSHHPDIFPSAARAGVPVVFSGHTHGGQIKGLPEKLITRSAFGLVEGVYKRDQSTLYLSRGLGVSGLPFRFNCPPQAWELTLRSTTGPHPEVVAAA